MNVEHETSDRHRRQSAIIHQFAPVAIAAFRDVEAKCGKKIARVDLAETARRQRLAQGDGFGFRVPLADQRRLERFEPVELGLLRQGRMIGDIVGFSREPIEGEDGSAILRCDKARGDGEILVPFRFARLPGLHGISPRARLTGATRPFQRPPRPRQ